MCGDRPGLCVVTCLTAYVRCGAYLRQAPGCGALPSTGPGLCVVWCGAYVFPRQASGSPQILRQAPAYAWYPGCLALLLMCGALPRQAPPMCSDRPMCGAVRCGAVRCFAYLRHPRPMCSARGALLCFAYVWCLTSTPPALLCLLRQGPGCFDSPRLPLMCFAVLCLLRHPPGVLCPGVLCLALPLACFALLCFACFACLCAYVFSTHTEGGDPGSLHEKKIKTKEF